MGVNFQVVVDGVDPRRLAAFWHMAYPPGLDWSIHCGYELRWSANRHHATSPDPLAGPQP
jgi:hypothetical protein